LPGAADFNGAVSASALPLSKAYIFDGIQSGSSIKQPANFIGTFSVAIIPNPIMDAFDSAKVVVSMQVMPEGELMVQEGLHQADFKAVKSKANLPKPAVNTIFDNVKAGMSFKTMFPTGADGLAPLYTVGFPLGSEKPLLEPKFAPKPKESKEKK
jgi:hypothetical protein